MPSWFTDGDDAVRYLGEVSRIWVVWLAALVLLFTMQQWWALLAVGAGLLFAMVILGRPLQARAARIPDAGEHVGSKTQTALGRGRRGDDAFRRLLYGEEPLRQALALAGYPAWLIWVRRVVLVVTVAAFVWVMLDLFLTSGPA